MNTPKTQEQRTPAVASSDLLSITSNEAKKPETICDWIFPIGRNHISEELEKLNMFGKLVFFLPIIMSGIAATIIFWLIISIGSIGFFVQWLTSPMDKILVKVCARLFCKSKS
jgi:hypothetical protein